MALPNGEIAQLCILLAHYVNARFVQRYRTLSQPDKGEDSSTKSYLGFQLLNKPARRGAS